MTLPIDSEPDLATALNAGCAALVALQSLDGPEQHGPADAGGVMRQIRHATSLVRATIDDLRAESEPEPSLLAFGFVLAAETGGATPLQVSPRRTA